MSYYYYEDEYTLDQRPINTSTNFTAIFTSSENTCPDHFPNGSGLLLDDTEIAALRTQYDENKDEYDNTYALFESLKDGGNTPGTISDIESSWPDETWELRAQLLSDSPHLSEEVLMEAAMRTDVLPDAIIFEICMANPEEMRNEKFLDFLATKEDPLPQYMIEELRDSADMETYKSVLLSEMTKYNILYSSAATQIIRNILLDSTGIKYDTLRVWLDKMGTLDAAYEKVDSYMAHEDYTNAAQVLADIPDDFELNEEQDKEYDYFYDLKSILITADQQNRNALMLDSAEVADLVYIADSSRSIAGAQARSLLNFAYGYNYFDLPETIKPGDKAGLVKDYGSINYSNKKEQYVTARPNPANNWVAFDYTLPYPAEKATLIITDVAGRKVKSIEVRQKQGQLIWDTRSIPAGIYIYSLKISGKTIDQRKLVVGH